MFNRKKRTKEIKQEITDTNKIILDKILINLDKAIKSGSFMVCISRLYVDEKTKEEKINHDIFTLAFKKDDIPISFKAYADQIKADDEKTGDTNLASLEEIANIE